MKKFFLNIPAILLLTIVIIALDSCSNSKTKEVTEETKSKNNTTKKELNIAVISEAQMKTVGIELGVIEQQNLTSVIKVNGQLRVPPQNKAVVKHW